MIKQIMLPIVALALFVSGCAPSELNRFEYAVAEGSCDVDALAEEKRTSLASINQSLYSIREHQNKAGTYEEQTYTILEDKLNRYSADLEASYRFVTQNCTIYSRCLERQDHDEWQCKRSEERWSQSQERFNQLVLGIREIDAEVAKLAILASKKKHKRKRKRCHDHDCDYDRDCHDRDCYPKPRPKSGCCDTINGIFTDCCDGRH